MREQTSFKSCFKCEIESLSCEELNKYDTSSPPPFHFSEAVATSMHASMLLWKLEVDGALTGFRRRREILCMMDRYRSISMKVPRFSESFHGSFHGSTSDFNGRFHGIFHPLQQAFTYSCRSFQVHISLHESFRLVQCSSMETSTSSIQTSSSVEDWGSGSGCRCVVRRVPRST